LQTAVTVPARQYSSLHLPFSMLDKEINGDLKAGVEFLIAEIAGGIKR
jgi:hypothetical protein